MEEIYMEVSPGYGNNLATRTVYKLKKACEDKSNHLEHGLEDLQEL